VLTLYNLANSAATVVGSAIGALILKAGEITPEAYHWVYAASSVLRVVAVAQLLVFRPQHSPSGDGDEDPAFQPLICQPNLGSIDEPIIAGTLKKDSAEIRASA
jgi:hypothetical protein